MKTMVTSRQRGP